MPVHVSDGDPVEVWVELEDGSARRADQVDHWVEPREVDGSRIGEATFAVPADLPLGYHRCTARSGDTEASAHLIVTPAWLGLPERRRASGRRGASPTQLYSVRSGGSRGASATSPTSTDLAVWSAGELGADFVLVNPLHAAEPLAPLEPSPYLPTHAGASSTRSTSASSGSPSTPRCRQPDAATRSTSSARSCRPGSTPRTPIDRDAAGRRSAPRSLIVHAVAAEPPGASCDFAAFRTREGDALRRVRHLVRARRGPRQRRPRAGRRSCGDPRPGGRRRSRREHADRVDFDCWLQWVLDEQLQRPRRRPVGRRHARSASCTTSPSACTPAAPTRGGCRDVYAAGRPGRRAAGPLQPARPELEPAAVAPGPARRARLRAVPRPDRRRAAARRRRPGRPRHRPVPAVVDPRGRAGRPRAPTSATTTRR